MSANVDEGARKLGERLLGEIEVESLTSVSPSTHQHRQLLTFEL
jgi:hypothetical protein